MVLSGVFMGFLIFVKALAELLGCDALGTLEETVEIGIVAEVQGVGDFAYGHAGMHQQTFRFRDEALVDQVGDGFIEIRFRQRIQLFRADVQFFCIKGNRLML